MIVHTECEQNSLEWLALRSGKPTASEFDRLFTPKMEPRKGEMPNTYLAQKLAERWIGGPLPGFQTLDMEFGQILEQEAKPYYTLEFSEEIQSVAFVTTDDGKIGCSPDGLVGDDMGLEIKCPKAETHVKYLLAGKLPDDYAAQVNGGLFVTGRKFWKFMSYRRNFPAFVTTIERDEKTMTLMGQVLSEFAAKLDEAFARLCDMNGGPPARPEPAKVAEHPEQPFDLIP